MTRGHHRTEPRKAKRGQREDKDGTKGQGACTKEPRSKSGHGLKMKDQGLPRWAVLVRAFT